MKILSYLIIGIMVTGCTLNRSGMIYNKDSAGLNHKILIHDSDLEQVISEKAEKFHEFITEEQKDQAYYLFSNSFQQNILTIVEFFTELNFLDEQYGLETQWKVKDVPGSRIESDVLYSKNILWAEYVSHRNEQVAMVLGFEQDENWQICAWGYQTDSENVVYESCGR